MRTNKKIMTHDDIDRRELGYYSTPNTIAKFMFSEMIKINPNGATMLDPCVGKEELIKDIDLTNLKIDGFDIYNHGDYKYCNFEQLNFLDFYIENKERQLNYDYYIANPPYNNHEVTYIRDNKIKLAKAYSDVGTYNMYSMFISSLIDLAKNGSVVAIITSDAFLTAKRQYNLRKKINDTCSIHSLILCPKDLFWEQKADVKTCIIILQKGKEFQRKVKTLSRPNNKEDLYESLALNRFKEVDCSEIINESSKNNFEYVVGMSNKIKSLFLNKRLGDSFTCICGITTGSDGEYVMMNKQDGFSIPIYRNPGSKKFYCEPNGYLTDDYLLVGEKNKSFMVRNKSFIKREGITCSNIGVSFSACYLPKGSAFGVNPNIFCENEADIWWLLAYLNSSLVTYLVRGVLIKGTISSGYISNVPMIPLSGEIKVKLSTISKKLVESKNTDPSVLKDAVDKIDDLVFTQSNLGEDTVSMIRDFADNLYDRV
jgi:hypothetical protein